ncbi:MAG: heparinase II/III family protein [Sphaerochaetaceae bacterium]
MEKPYMETSALGEAFTLAMGEGHAAHTLFADLCGTSTPATLKADPALAGYLLQLKRRASRLRGSDIPSIPFGLYRLYDTTGDRSAFEAVYFARREYLLVMALCAWLWEDPRDVQKLEDCLWSICDEFSWSLPAHMHGASLSNHPQTLAYNRINLDLFACETGLAVTECCAMLNGRLSPVVVARVRAAVLRRTLDSYIASQEPWDWELMENNWCAVCAGSLGAIALYLSDDIPYLCALMQRLQPTLGRFLNSFTADGACREGLSYWTYGFGFYVVFADLLAKRTNGRIDLLGWEKCQAIARFQQNCYFPGGVTLSFSDGSSHDGFRRGLTGYLFQRFSDVAIPPASRAMGPLQDPCFRFAPVLRDLVWPVGKTAGKPLGKGNLVRFHEAQWLLVHNGASGLAAKGGHNDEPHNHNDVGSFIYYRYGKMVLCDLGAGAYTKAYFHEGRYGIFCNQSESHNLPIIGGNGQKAGAQYRALGCIFDPDGAGLSLDIAPAYGIGALAHLERHLVFDQETGSVRIEDHVQFGSDPLEVVERFVTLLPVQVGASGSGEVAIDCGQGHRCILRGPSQVAPRISHLTHIDHTGQTVTVFGIDYSLGGDCRDMMVSFTIV